MRFHSLVLAASAAPVVLGCAIPITRTVVVEVQLYPVATQVPPGPDALYPAPPAETPSDPAPLVAVEPLLSSVDSGHPRINLIIKDGQGTLTAKKLAILTTGPLYVLRFATFTGDGDRRRLSDALAGQRASGQSRPALFWTRTRWSPRALSQCD
ncbi:hypothetical protein HYQ44_020171 [Verticillium longisporum]|nr:hypothetical protein HYQ44_020171 [Verticillium longisporum]